MWWYALQYYCFPLELVDMWASDLSWSHQAEMFQREILKRGQPLTFDYVIDNLKHLHVIDKQVNINLCLAI